MTGFKVRDMLAGRYQTEKFDFFNREFIWSKRGKTWKTLDELRSHFAILAKCHTKVSPLWEVVDLATGETYPASSLSTGKP